MLKRLAGLMLIGLMAVVPIQGTAVALAQIMCHPEDHHSAHVQSDAQDHQDTSHHHAGGEGASGHESAPHFCCDHLATGIPSSAATAAAVDFAVYEPHPLPPLSLFEPEQPRRPPRA